MAFSLSSPAFENGQAIPKRHARDGENLSPFLQWEDPPPGTRSFAMLMEDPDAPSMTFRHWGVYNIPAQRTHLAEGRSSGAATEVLPHAFNDFGNNHYDGPEPPEGDPAHTYRFRLAALDVAELDLDPSATAAEMWERVRTHLLAAAELTGTYKR